MCDPYDTGPIQNAARSGQSEKLYLELLILNAFVTVTMQSFRRLEPEMNSVKAALLSFAMLSAIVLCGLGIYSADAANNHHAVDGYGVVASVQN